MGIDIHSAVQTALVLTLVGVVLSIWVAIRAMRSASRIPFFRLRQRQIAGGWRLLILSLILCIFAFILYRYAEPVAYRYYPPTITATFTPSVSVTPTISETPTITLTPTITQTSSIIDTITPSPTPFLPPAIEALFESTVTPNPESTFSQLVFARSIKNYQPINPGIIFRNPIRHIYGVFTYDGMVPGAQWTAIWYREGQLVYYETMPWDGGTGGYGYTDWFPSPEEWLPGDYEVFIFIGTEWKTSGRFAVEGQPPTSTLTPSPTFTPTPSNTPTITRTPTQSNTPRPTDTRWPTKTPD